LNNELSRSRKSSTYRPLLGASMVKVPIWTPFTGARIWMPLGDLLHLDQIRRHFAHRSADEPASQLYELILRSRTPDPPSASKMKSTPAASSVRRTAAKLETVIAKA
jgi:hypothetical protein